MKRIFNQLYHTRNGAGTIRQIYELISTRHLGAKEIPGMEKLLPLVDSIIPSQRLELDNSVRYVYGALMDDVLKLMDARGNVQGDSRESAMNDICVSIGIFCKAMSGGESRLW